MKTNHVPPGTWYCKGICSQEPRIFLLDEPSCNLDLKNQLHNLHTIL
ncbi:MAG: hypothetical protein ACOC0C_05505 [Bacteroidota bacterium]